MGTGLIVAALVLSVVALGVVAAAVVKAGRRERDGERARVADEQRLDRERSLTSVDAMSGTGFEDHVAALCRRDGCTEVARVGGGGDLGADVVGRLPDGRRLVIQCKRYATHRSVGSGDVQRFNGTARLEHGADVPVIVTATVFTTPAREFAAKHALTLIDRDLLGFWQNGTPLSSFLALDIKRSGRARPRRPSKQ
ncbi:restriction endonuclease [Embleya sp. NPDC050154]|uniref:restriction endonuclease n=1 Tax=unclassified Embleya TaxID=2699296 RepID=UPI002F918597|nr:restriction endonuclease [Embleya sp. NBC_00888]